LPVPVPVPVLVAVKTLVSIEYAPHRNPTVDPMVRAERHRAYHLPVEVRKTFKK
jgi:hypothetical protein